MTTTSTAATHWFWFGTAFGVRFRLPEGFFLAPEVSFGGSGAGDLSASAVVKMGYGF